VLDLPSQKRRVDRRLINRPYSRSHIDNQLCRERRNILGGHPLGKAVFQKSSGGFWSIKLSKLDGTQCLIEVKSNVP
jgi:hypothetical protein